MDTQIDCPDKVRLSVKRDSDRDIKFRGLRVLVDGRDWVDLQYGEGAEICLSPGTHQLTVTNNLYKKVAEFEAKANESITFHAGNFMNGIGAVMIVAFGIGPYKVFLEREAA